jgi:hypothetical protein
MKGSFGSPGNKPGTDGTFPNSSRRKWGQSRQSPVSVYSGGVEAALAVSVVVSVAGSLEGVAGTSEPTGVFASAARNFTSAAKSTSHR